MKMTFRHYGPSDPVTLEQISQIPTVRSIVSAVYDVPAGGVWSYDNTQYWFPNHTYYFAALAPVEDAHWSVVEATDDAGILEERRIRDAGDQKQQKQKVILLM